MYDFSTLSPTDFENFVRDILQASEGIKLESFAVGRDQGIDFRYAGKSGHTIVQAKHYLRSGFSKLKSACAKEKSKAKDLAPQRYIFATSVSLSVGNKDEIRKVFAEIPLELADILGQEELNARLRDHPEIEKKHFKLWLSSTAVLDQILKSGLYERSDSELEQIKLLIPKYVEHGGLGAAEDILAEHNTLIISGPPGIGKTSLARMLIWLHAQQGWQIKVIDSIDDAFEAISKSEKQLIFFDDFLGQVRVTDDLVRGTDSRLPPFLERVKNSKHLRFILTTRDYILLDARRRSSRLDNAAEARTSFILNVSQYSRRARAQILFNHIYFSTLSDDQISELLEEDFYLKIIDHKNFNPRIVEQITKSGYLDSNTSPIQSTIWEVLEYPELLWNRPYREHFSYSAQILMIAQSISTRFEQIQDLRKIFTAACKGFGHNIPLHNQKSEFDSSLKFLEGTTLDIADGRVRFVNPGVRDFMNGVLVKDGLIVPLLGATDSTYQIQKLWDLANSASDKPEGNASIWFKSVDRVLDDSNSADLEEISLLLDFFRKFGIASHHLAILQKAAAKLSLLEAGGVDVSKYQKLFEQLESVELPEKILELVLQEVGANLEKCANKYGGELTIQEATQFMDFVGLHPLATGQFLDAGIFMAESSLDNASSELNDLETEEDIESLQYEAENLASTANLFWSTYSTSFEDRKAQVRTEDTPDFEEYERSRSSTPTPRPISDEDEIKSMFSTLK